MKRTAAIACGVVVMLGAGTALTAAGPDDKKPVRKPVINLDGSAKQRRPGQVMPGDVSPGSSTPAPAKPVEAPAATTPAPPQSPPPSQLLPQPAPAVPAAEPIPAATPPKVVLPPPKLHASAAGVSSAPANAQARRLGAVGTGEGAIDAPWADLSSTWGDDAPIDVRVGVHAPVVIRVAGIVDASGAPAPATLVTLWPMARAMIGPELVDGRWVAGVRLTRGQVTVQPEAAASPITEGSGWTSVVRTPDRSVQVGGRGGRVAYDPVRRTRSWTLIVE